MTERELKKLTRNDLLEMMLSLSKENEELRKQLKEANEKLEDRRIAVEEAGSLAEAAFRLNGVFEAAQATCEQYIQNIRLRHEEQEQICRQMEQITREKCNALLAQAKAEAAACLEEAHRQAGEQEAGYDWLAELMREEPKQQD